MGDQEKETLKIIDTRDGLTREELRELKALANMSKTAKTIMAFVIGALGLFGVDHVVTWLNAHK